MNAILARTQAHPLLMTTPLVMVIHAVLLVALVQMAEPLRDILTAPGFAIDLEPMAGIQAPAVAPPQPKAEAQPHPHAKVETPAPPRPQVKAVTRRVPVPTPSPAALPREDNITENPAIQAMAESLAPPAMAGTEAAASAPVSPPVALPSVEMSRWQGMLMAHLERHKRYPRDAWMRRQEGVVAIRFVMSSSGKVLSAVIERASGVESLDRETLALIERAQPMPRPPGETGAQVDLVVPVHFQLR